MLTKRDLQELYLREGLSVSVLAKRLSISQGQVNYWLKKHDIPKRSISEAIYQKWNPEGDPFSQQTPKNIEQAILYGVGIGLYWGEGTKASKTSVRLGNSNPALIKKFMDFLERFYSIDRNRLRFGLQIFGDMDPNHAVRYWMQYLGIQRKQFYPTIVITPHRGVGNYRNKTRYGVLTLYFNNKKLRDIIVRAVEDQSASTLPK